MPFHTDSPRYTKYSNLVVKNDRTVTYHSVLLCSPLPGGRALHVIPVRLSVCPENSKTENHTTFRLRVEVTYIKSNRQSNF